MVQNVLKYQSLAWTMKEEVRKCKIIAVELDLVRREAKILCAK